ncbi:hypothetical protein [Aquimarina brevivitae]|uniref:Lipoprotein n=1 Tax=Aquimarina brevivitae TaxID=323412 RepID=A0A4V2F7D7_9FLAO|nr:hypothetical protein [Aquimarina brevivitae]RZS99459.1 hypothetical protein EV197_0669 [Aquimarina brevivitae]
MKKIFFLATLVAWTLISCSKEPVITDEESLRLELGLKNQTLSTEAIQQIQSTTKPIHFESLEDAKRFLSGAVTFSSANFYDKFKLAKDGKPNSYPMLLVDGDNILKMSCPPIILEPVEGCNTSGGGGGGNCGSGSATFTVRQNGVLNYNVSINYNSETGEVEVSGISSYISGVTLGVSWTQHNTNTSVNDNTIEFEVNGTLNYNIVFEGIGTVYRQDTTIRGAYNPCANDGAGRGGIEEFLQVAN